MKKHGVTHGWRENRLGRQYVEIRRLVAYRLSKRRRKRLDIILKRER